MEDDWFVDGIEGLFQFSNLDSFVGVVRSYENFHILLNPRDWHCWSTPFSARQFESGTKDQNGPSELDKECSVLQVKRYGSGESEIIQSGSNGTKRSLHWWWWIVCDCDQ